MRGFAGNRRRCVL